jgi:hypothetical protein
LSSPAPMKNCWLREGDMLGSTLSSLAKKQFLTRLSSKRMF